MKNNLIYIILFNLFFSLNVYAINSPNNFLHDFIESDAFSNGTNRLGKIIFTDKKPIRICDGDECSEPREIFDLRGDPLVIINNIGKILNCTTYTQNASCYVLYHVVAVTQGNGYGEDGRNQRHIMPLKYQEYRKIEYNLVTKNNKWYVINPTLPYVNIYTLINAIQEQIDRNIKIILTSSYKDITLIKNKRLAQLKWFESELHILKSLTVEK